MTAEPIDIPVTPVAFRPTDKKHFTGDWGAFRDKLHAIATAEASGDTKAYAAATGQSERNARRKTQPARKQQTADRNADIVRRAETETHEQIATAWGISEKTVQRVIKKHKKTRHTELDTTDKTLLYNSNSDLSDMSTPQKTDEPSRDSELLNTGEPSPTQETGQDIDTPIVSDPAYREPVPITEYSKFSEPADLRPEYEHCIATDNYNGAAYLRTLFRNRGWKLQLTEQDAPDRLEVFVMERLNISREAASALLDLPISDPRSAELRKHIKPPDYIRQHPMAQPPMVPPAMWGLPPAPPTYEQIHRKHPNLPSRCKEGFVPTCDADWDREIVKMYNEGHSIDDIATALDHTIAYVRNLLGTQDF